jgi:serine/threonine protein kinase
MGEVYRARDTMLARDVAIKILPEAFAADAGRVARFQREAKTLASLNHPNIAAIYGLEHADGRHALVMELVEGEDLSQRIARGPIPLDEALPLAKQIADALEAAHEQAIIHRDLKPANIKVRADGTVKVLDFGLAKAMEPAGSAPNLSRSPTLTTPAMTQAGMILGTAAYMSPEQARGKAVDKRADIWAFGCVLYEMLTGRRAFPGESLTVTAAKKSPLGPFFSVALAVGLRLGEALALGWDAVDLKTKKLSVRRALQRTKDGVRFVEPKSERSRRTVTLPEFAVTAMERQRAAQKKARFAAGTKWFESGLVFTTSIGTALDERNVRREFLCILEAAKLPSIRILDLRHTCASLLIAQGVHQRVVMEILGHSQISITMDTYSHVLPAVGADAAKKLNAAVS